MANTKDEILAVSDGGIQYYLKHLPTLHYSSGKSKCKNIRNPFYDDKNASLSIFKKDGLWFFKDFGDDRYAGDVFDFAAIVHRLSVKTDFKELLEVMQRDLLMQADTVSSTMIVHKQYTTEGLRFWSQYGIDEGLLSNWYVHEVASYLVDGKFKDCSTTTFSYNTGRGYKLYRPFAKANRFSFVGGKRDGWVFGEASLDRNADLCIITGSEKDLLACLANSKVLFPGLVVTGIALNSETAVMQQDLVARLRSSFSKVLLIFDADSTGVTQSRKRSEETGFSFLKWPESIGAVNDPLHRSPCKDLADWCYMALNNLLGCEPSLLSFIVQSTVPAIADTRLVVTETSIETSSEQSASTKQKRQKQVLDFFKRNAVSKNELTDEVQWVVSGTTKQVSLETLYNSIILEGITYGAEDLKSLIKSDFTTSYNPIRQYLDGLPDWTGEDHFSRLCSFIETGLSERLESQFTKWFIRMIRCALEPEYFNKQMLVLVSERQNIGKTSFLRWLLPKELSKYYQENPDLKDKDALLAATQCIFLNFDELGALKRFGLEFKALMSMGQIRVRKHYASSSSSLIRVCSMVASTNEYDFISDESGSVRYLAFEVFNLDFNYSSEISIDSLWAQAYAYYKADSCSGEMSREELEENAVANEQFMDQPEVETIIRKFYRRPRNGEVPVYLSASELKEALVGIFGIAQCAEVTLGRTLTRLFGQRRTTASDKIKRYAMVPLTSRPVTDSAINTS